MDLRSLRRPGRRVDASHQREYNHENIKLGSSGELGNGRRHSRGVARAFSRCAYRYRHSEQCATIEEEKKSVMSRAHRIPGETKGVRFYGTYSPIYLILASVPPAHLQPPPPTPLPHLVFPCDWKGGRVREGKEKRQGSLSEQGVTSSHVRARQDRMGTADENNDNAPVAFLLVICAGLSTGIGAAFVFNKRLVSLCVCVCVCAFAQLFVVRAAKEALGVRFSPLRLFERTDKAP